MENFLQCFKYNLTMGIWNDIYDTYMQLNLSSTLFNS